MKSMIIKIAVGVAVLALGFGVVILGDRQGWFGDRGGAAGPAVAAACAHGMTDPNCPFCDPSLVESMGFCQGHGVPEAYCVKCFPAVAAAFKATGDWCGEHAVPESLCELCNPGVLAKYAPGAAATPAGTPTQVAAQPSRIEPGSPFDAPAADSALRHLRSPNVACTTQDLRVQLTSPEMARAAGIEVQPVAAQAVTQSVEAPMELSYDSTRLAHLRPRADGIVQEVYVDLGEQVEAGQILVALDSAEVSQRKADYLKLYRESLAAAELVERLAAWHERVNDLEIRLTANKLLENRTLLLLARENLQREEAMMATGTTSEREVMEARSAVIRAENAVAEAQRTLQLFGIDAAAVAALTAEQIVDLKGRGSASEQPLLEARRTHATSLAQLRAARDQLQVLGLDAAAIQTVLDREDTSGRLTVAAPFAGTVIERHATLGETINREHALFTVGDTSRLWAMLDVKEADIPQLRLGQPVILELAGLRGQRFAGTLTWLSTAIDRRTRTLKARVTVDNPDGLLRAGMYGQARVNIRDRSQALVVPRESVQWDGCCNLVFVRHSEVLYEPRKVQLSYETEHYFLADSGVAAGEEIVTTGSFLMKTEIMKGNIGAGCCEVEPVAN